MKIKATSSLITPLRDEAYFWIVSDEHGDLQPAAELICRAYSDYNSGFRRNNFEVMGYMRMTNYPKEFYLKIGKKPKEEHLIVSRSANEVQSNQFTIKRGLECSMSHFYDFQDYLLKETRPPKSRFQSLVRKWKKHDSLYVKK